MSFRPDVIKEEEKRENFVRFSSGAFQALAGQCEVGTASAVLASEDSQKISELLETVRLWRQLPIAAVFYAMQQGVQFPPQGAVLKLEEMDGLAKRMADDEDELLELIQNAKQPVDHQTLCWLRAMVFAVMRIHEWKGGETDWMLARAFAEVERAFLPVCFSTEALCQENLFLLPPTHRFGWYCDKAFAALDHGDGSAFVRYLRSGLSAYESMREMVGVILKDFEQVDKRRSATPELLALAEQVRTMLRNFAPDDPALAAIKQSPVYQKVAYLIEGAEVPMMGGLVQ